MTGHVPEEWNDESGCEFRIWIVEFRRKIHPHLLALASRPGQAALPRVLRFLPTTSGSMVQSGMG
jgi:hypothetical protein